MLSRSTFFNSPIKSAPRLALPFFIVLAALLHLSTVYLFKIVYAPSHVSKPAPAQILFLTPTSPSSQQISFWLKSNDPSIFSPLKTVQGARASLPSSIYEPKPASLPLHRLPVVQKDPANDLLPPTDEAVLPAVLAQTTVSAPAASAVPAQQATTIQLSDPLSARLTASLSPPALPREVQLPLSPTTLTLNIDAEGTPHHVIVSQSCGNAAADEAASRWAMGIRFEKADHETWGRLLVIWGSK